MEFPLCSSEGHFLVPDCCWSQSVLVSSFLAFADEEPEVWGQLNQILERGRAAGDNLLGPMVQYLSMSWLLTLWGLKGHWGRFWVGWILWHTCQMYKGRYKGIIIKIRAGESTEVHHSSGAVIGWVLGWALGTLGWDRYSDRYWA